MKTTTNINHNTRLLLPVTSDDGREGKDEEKQKVPGNKYVYAQERA